MTAFAYTTGNPSRLTGGGVLTFSDIGNSFVDFDTWIDGTNLDATNLSASLVAVYKTLCVADGSLAAPSVAGTFFPAVNAGRVMWQSGVTGSIAVNSININSADFPLSGLSPFLRLRTTLLTNATAPASNFVMGLYPISSVTGTGGQQTVNLGTVVSGTTLTRNAPAASSVLSDTTSDFAVPSAGLYTFGVTNSTTTATNSVQYFSFRLEYRWA